MGENGLVLEEDGGATLPLQLDRAANDPSLCLLAWHNGVLLRVLPPLPNVSLQLGP